MKDRIPTTSVTKASPEFMEIADAMYRAVKKSCPRLFERVLRSYEKKA